MTATKTVDEETPLLIHGQSKKPTPLPWAQFSIVLFLQLAEPLTSNVIYPFMPQLIRDLGITKGNDAAVGYYVGMMQSIFFLTQAFTVLHWARLSDTIGRKPVILIGLSGLSVSMYCFGLARTFWGLVLCRSLSGALNGNIGVIKSMMAELTDETNLAQAYAYLPIAWCTGCTLGPIIGGLLSRPSEQLPWLFGDSPFHKKYPYFLAISIPATFSLVAWTVAYCYLKETHPNPMPIKQYLGFEPKPCSIDDVSDTDTDVGSVDSTNSPSQSKSKLEKPGSLRSLLTPRVVLAATNYAFLSLVDIAFRAIQPVFLSTPIELGGLGLDPARIGKVLSVFGVLNGFFQVFFFAAINNRLGSKNTFLMGIASAVPLFVSYPVMNALAKMYGLSLGVWVLVYGQIVLSIGTSLAYGSIFIFITAASPNRASLGATNGICQMSVSVMRAIGPAAANSLFSVSIEKDLLGGRLVYYVLIVTTFLTFFIGTFLPNKLWKQDA